MEKKTKTTIKKTLKKLKIPELFSQLHRIIGQLKAVERMIEQGKNEKDILMVLDAACNSLRSLRNSFIKKVIRDKLAGELESVLSLVDK